MQIPRRENRRGGDSTLSPRRALRARNHRAAFTLVEMMITVAVMGIAAAIILPAMSNNDATYADAGSSLLVGDFDFAQTMAISQPDDMTVVIFDAPNARWWVAPASTPDTPYTKSYSTETVDTTLGTGNAYIAQDVTFTLTNVTNSTITYNAFGQLDQTTNPEITFSFGDATSTITINAETGFLTVE